MNLSLLKSLKQNQNEKNIYKIPAVAANLSTLLKHVGNLIITKYTKKDGSEKN